MASTLRDDNRVVAGEFWPSSGTEGPELSVEQGYAESLGWKIGDQVAFDVAGQRFAATITSLGVDFYTLQVRIDLDDDTGAHQDIALDALSIIYTEPA